MKICKRILCCFICALLIAFTPISNFITTSAIKVYAADWVIIGGAGEVAIDYLIALLGTVGLGSAFVANRDEIIDLYNSKVQAEQATREMAYDCAMKIYDKASDTVKSIPFNEYFDSLQSFADNAYDTVSDVYFKLSPEIISFTQEFVTDLVSGDILVNGEQIFESNSIQSVAGHPQAIDYTISEQIGTFTAKAYAVYEQASQIFLTDNFFEQNIDTSKYRIFCVVNSNNDVLNPYSIRFYKCQLDSFSCSDFYMTYTTATFDKRDYSYTPKDRYYSHYAMSCFAYSTNFPVFSSVEDGVNWVKGQTVPFVSMFPSAWDTIIENNDIPDFSKEADKLWNRAIDHGIGLSGYGSGVAGTAEWSDDIPWLLNPSLRDWANDVIDRVRDSILDGSYVGNPDIPDNPSYVDVWDNVVDIPWDVVIDTDTPVSVPWETDKPLVVPNNPTVDIDKPIVDNPSVDNPSIDTDIPEVIEPTLPVVEGISVTLKDKFPFCIPWDLVSLFNIFVAEPSPPYFEIPFNIEYLKLDYTFVLDLSLYNTVSKVCRSLFVILFILGLIKLTPFMLSFGKDL